MSVYEPVDTLGVDTKYPTLSLAGISLAKTKRGCRFDPTQAESPGLPRQLRALGTRCAGRQASPQGPWGSDGPARDSAANLGPGKGIRVTGDELRMWRQKTFTSQERAADWYGTHPRTWRRWELGERPIPQHVINRVQNLDPLLGRPGERSP